MAGGPILPARGKPLRGFCEYVEMRDGSGCRAQRPNRFRLMPRTRLDHKSNEPNYWPKHSSASTESAWRAGVKRGLQLGILAICFLLPYPLASDLRRLSDPQLKVQLRQQALKPARVPAGFRPHAHFHPLCREIVIELLHFLAVP